MMLPNSCFFIGNHDCPEIAYPNIINCVEKVIFEDNIIHFYVGNHGNFDQMAAKAVKQIKQNRPDIKLYLLMPYPKKRLTLESGFDDVFIPPDIPKGKFCIIRANQYMADHVDCIITGIYRHEGNTQRILKHVRKRYEAGSLRIENTLASMRVWGSAKASDGFS